MALYAGVLVFVWFEKSPDHPLYGLLVATGTFVLGPGVAIPVLIRVPPRWFRVPANECVLHRALGVEAFAWVLKHSRYSRRPRAPSRRNVVGPAAQVYCFVRVAVTLTVGYPETW